MKTIGLIGGMSWESSLEYYRIINQTIRQELGGSHSGKIIMFSVDFEEVEQFQHQGKWNEAAKLIIEAAKRLEMAGANFVVVCSNTMHKVADQVQQKIKIPLVHIADTTAERIRARGLKKIGLLGTKFTMEEDFYKDRLIGKYALDVIVPTTKEREIIHNVIYCELCLGERKQSSKRRFKHTMQNLAASGAEGIVLACTEIGLLVGQDDIDVPLFDTTAIHAQCAAELAVKE